MSFNTCRDCGEPVRWARSERGKMVRLTPLEMHYVVDANNVAKRVTTYDMHVCDDTDRVRHNEAMADAELRREQYELLRQRLWEAALTYSCEKCGAVPTQYCANLQERKKGNLDAVTRWPHDERVPEPIRVEIHEELAGP